MWSLTHENILKLHEVYESETTIYLVLDLINGGDLSGLIKEKRQKLSIYDTKKII